MNDQDAVAVLATIQVLWPNFPGPQTEESMRVYATLWAEVLADVGLDDVLAAVKREAKSGAAYAPAPGRLISLIRGDDSIPVGYRRNREGRVVPL